MTTRDIKISFLGITPVLEDKTGVLNSQQIVSFSALLTFKGKSVQDLLKESIGKGQDLNEKIKNILRRSSLKGHASMATTPVLCFSYEASKFLDSALTGMTFASALMASGRRTDTTINDIVYPTTILKNKRAKGIYRIASEKNINFANELLAKGVQKDEASKILQYGIYGTGIVQFPIESIVSLKREYEAEKKWMPEEVGFLLSAIERELKNFGIDLLYLTRLIAPRNTYPYPNIFKDPTKTNLVREMELGKFVGDFKIISYDFLPTSGLEKEVRNLNIEIKKVVKRVDVLKEKWPVLLQKRQKIGRDYNLAANIKILSNVAWRVWGDKKRHRTIPMIVDSVYYFVERAQKTIKKYRAKIESKKLTAKELDIIDRIYAIPPAIRKNNRFLYQWLSRADDSLQAYDKLIKVGVAERDAIFVIPRGLKFDVLQDYNLYNLIAGYYPLRLCSTAEEELRRLTIKEVAAIRNLLKKEGMGLIADSMVTKCQVVGFCLEEKTCGVVKSLNRDYDENMHQEMKKDLETKFQNGLAYLE